MEKKIITLDEIMQNAESSIDFTVDRMEKIHGSYWKSRAELAKLIISLSSVILVGTITFSGSLLGQNTTHFSFILIVSWTAFFTTLIGGVFCLYFSTKLHKSHAIFNNSTTNIEDEIKEKAPESDDPMKIICDIIGKKSNEAFNPLGEADKNAEIAIKITIVTFVCGLLLFIIFGSSQILKKPLGQQSSQTHAEEHMKS